MRKCQIHDVALIMIFFYCWAPPGIRLLDEGKENLCQLQSSPGILTYRGFGFLGIRPLSHKSYLNPILFDVQLVGEVFSSEDVRVVRTAEGQLQLVQLEVAECCPSAFGLLWFVHTLCFTMAGVGGGLSITVSTVFVICFTAG